MVVITKSKNSNVKVAVSSGMDKHKMWGIAGVVFFILVVAILVGYPLLQKGKAVVGHADFGADGGGFDSLSTILPVETLCSDGVDNDKDGKYDCADGDCGKQLFCQDVCPGGDCFSNLGKACKSHADCNSVSGGVWCVPDKNICAPSTETSCVDKEDNNQNGDVDCADIGCKNTPLCAGVAGSVSLGGSCSQDTDCVSQDTMSCDAVKKTCVGKEGKMCYNDFCPTGLGCVDYVCTKTGICSGILCDGSSVLAKLNDQKCLSDLLSHTCLANGQWSIPSEDSTACGCAGNTAVGNFCELNGDCASKNCVEGKCAKSTEVCNNAKDDDNDGQIDCLDPDCVTKTECTSVACTDSDGGNVATVKGKVINAEYPSGKEDKCGTLDWQGVANLLYEQDCNGWQQVEYQVKCHELGSDYKCVEGACVKDVLKINDVCNLNTGLSCGVGLSCDPTKNMCLKDLNSVCSVDAECVEGLECATTCVKITENGHRCHDGLDNDKDGNIDCKDSECSDGQFCTCADGYACTDLNTPITGKVGGETVCGTDLFSYTCVANQGVTSWQKGSSCSCNGKGGIGVACAASGDCVSKNCVGGKCGKSTAPSVIIGNVYKDTTTQIIDDKDLSMEGVLLNAVKSAELGGSGKEPYVGKFKSSTVYMCDNGEYSFKNDITLCAEGFSAEGNVYKDTTTQIIDDKDLSMEGVLLNAVKSAELGGSGKGPYVGKFKSSTVYMCDNGKYSFKNDIPAC